MRTILANLLIREEALKILLENGFFTKFLSMKQSQHMSQNLLKMMCKQVAVMHLSIHTLIKCTAISA